jgi:hypothetical protein
MHPISACPPAIAAGSPAVGSPATAAAPLLRRLPALRTAAQVAQSTQATQDVYAKQTRAIASIQEDKIDYWLGILGVLARDDVKQLLNSYTAQWEDLCRNFSPISAHRFCVRVADTFLLDRNLGFNKRGRYDPHKYHDRLKVREIVRAVTWV